MLFFCPSDEMLEVASGYEYQIFSPSHRIAQAALFLFCKTAELVVTLPFLALNPVPALPTPGAGRGMQLNAPPVRLLDPLCWDPLPRCRNSCISSAVFVFVVVYRRLRRIIGETRS